MLLFHSDSLFFHYCFIACFFPQIHYSFLAVLLLALSLLFPCSFLICERPILSQISQIYADERQLGQMDLLKQMP